MPLRDAWWFVPWPTNQARGRPTLGSTAWAGENPPFGATFTVHVPEVQQTAADERRDGEQSLRDRGDDVPFPGYDVLRSERNESGPMARLRISDDSGTPIRWVEVPAREGVHRVTWDLRHPAPNPVNFADPAFRPPWVTEPTGPLAAPGPYSAQLVMIDGEAATDIGEVQSFALRPVPTAPAGTDFQAVAAFHLRVAELQRQISIASSEMAQASERVRFMRAALDRTPAADPALYGRLDALVRRLDDFRYELNGDPVRGSLSQSSTPSISARAGRAAASWGTRQTPTGTMQESLRLAETGFATFRGELAAFLDGEMAEVEQALADAGAPWTPGRRVSG